MTWSGLYLGFHSGVGSARYRNSEGFAPGTLAGIYDGTDPLPSPSSSRMLLGGVIGYNWARPLLADGFSLIVGLEGEAGYLEISKLESTGSFGVAGNMARFEYEHYAGVSTRLGFAWGKGLLFAKGGVAFAQVTNEAADIDAVGIDSSDLTRFEKTLPGYSVGCGLEYAITDICTVKAEYLYMDFGTTLSSNADGETWRHQNQLHTVKMGLHFHF